MQMRHGLTGLLFYLLGVTQASSTHCSAETCYVKLEECRQLHLTRVVSEQHESPESAGHTNTPAAPLLLLCDSSHFAVRSRQRDPNVETPRYALQ